MAMSWLVDLVHKQATLGVQWLVWLWWLVVGLVLLVAVLGALNDRFFLWLARYGFPVSQSRYGLGPPVPWTRQDNGGLWYLQRVGSNDHLLIGFTRNIIGGEHTGRMMLSFYRRPTRDACLPHVSGTRILENLRLVGRSDQSNIRQSWCNIDESKGVIQPYRSLWTLHGLVSFLPRLGGVAEHELVVLFLSRRYMVLGNYARSVLRVYSRSLDTMSRDDLRQIVRALRETSGYGTAAFFDHVQFVDPTPAVALGSGEQKQDISEQSDSCDDDASADAAGAAWDRGDRKSSEDNQLASSDGAFVRAATTLGPGGAPSPSVTDDTTATADVRSSADTDKGSKRVSVDDQVYVLYGQQGFLALCQSKGCSMVVDRVTGARHAHFDSLVSGGTYDCVLLDE